MDFLDLFGLRKKKSNLPMENDYTTASFINAVPRVTLPGGSIDARMTTPREFSFVDPQGPGNYAAPGNAPQVIPPWLTGSVASVFLNSGSPAQSGNYYGASFADFISQVFGGVTGTQTTPTPPTNTGGSGSGAGGSGSTQTNSNPPPAVDPVYTQPTSPPSPPAPPPVQGGVVINSGGLSGGGQASTFQTIYGGSSNAGNN